MTHRELGFPPMPSDLALYYLETLKQEWQRGYA